MRNLIVLVGILLINESCDQFEKSDRKLDAYFDLDSLLDSQVQLLSDQKAEVMKTVIMDGTVETQRSTPDTTGWKDEFKIIRDFNLNKPYYVGAYYKKTLDDGVRYVEEEGVKVPVSEFIIKSTDGALEKINATYFEDKTIYQHKRVLELNFAEDKLTAYRISGFQKMVLKDTIFYTISGEIN
ncbi:MAG: hypothetical protein RIC35_02925 [Marinoscillum sp.]